MKNGKQHRVEKSKEKAKTTGSDEKADFVETFQGSHGKTLFSKTLTTTQKKLNE